MTVPQAQDDGETGTGALAQGHLQEWLMQAPVAFAVFTGPDHTITFTSAEYDRLVQRPTAGRTVRDAFPELAGQGIFELLDRVYTTGEPFVGHEIPVRLQRGESGQLRQEYRDVVYQPMRNADGDVEGIFVHSVDVTDGVTVRKALEAEVGARRRAQALLAGERSILETIARGYPLSQTLEALAGFIEERSQGALCSILLLEAASEISDVPRLRHGAAPSLADTYNSVIDGITIGPAVGSCGTAAFRGEPVIVTDIEHDPLWDDFRDLALVHDLRACWSTPIRGPDGEILGTFALYYRQPTAPSDEEREMVSVLTYLAGIAIERHRNEQERVHILQREREAREEAEVSVQVRDEFLSIASHELRTPATVIKGVTQLWQRSARRGTLTPQRIVQYVETVGRSSDRLSLLINDLLDVSRLQSGQFSLRLELVDLREFVRDIVERHAEQAELPDSIRMNLPDTPVTVNTDPARLEQVLDNMLSNAVKYSPDGSSIDVTVESSGTEVTIAVRDAGIGLPGGAAESIFEPFGRAENAVRRNLPGMGLGLYICRRIAELHGGVLWAESAGEDQGTKFQFRLPLAVPAVMPHP